MILFWGVAAMLACVAIAVVLAPIWRHGAPSVGHRDGALAIFADQIAEVDRDAARGIISSQEAEAAKVEIKRRMLAAAKSQSPSPASRTGRGIVVVIAVLVPLAAGGVYWQLGSPGLPSLPYETRADERAADAEINALISELRQRLDQEDNGGETEGWVLLGQTYMRLQRFGDAALAFARVADRDDVSGSTLSQYAEALIAAEGGLVTNRAAVIAERALELAPQNPAATFYFSQWLVQEGRAREAEALLVARIGAEQEAQPWMQFYLSLINQIRAQNEAPPVSLAELLSPAAPGPSAADVAAASELSDEERGAFIRSMVEGLAARLQESPDDLDGWIRLGQAYRVLGDTTDAIAAYRSALPLLAALPADDPRQGVVREALAQLGAPLDQP